VKIFVVLVLLLTTKICPAFEDNDFQIWNAAKLYFKFNKNWQVEFQEEFRFGRNVRHLYYQHSDIGFTRLNVKSWLDVGFNYRQIFEKDNKGDWTKENSPHINFTLKDKWGDYKISNRLRIQFRDRKYKKDLWRYRNKFTVKFPHRLTALKLQPYLADEIFINLNSEGYNRNRFYSGVSFNLNKQKNLKSDIFFLLQRSRSKGQLKDINILGASLKYRF